MCSVCYFLWSKSQVYSRLMSNHLLPPESDPDAQIADMASELSELDISKDMKALLERGLHSHRLPKSMRGVRAAEAIQIAFEVIGGPARLALWADRNPDKFFQLFARMVPQTIAPVLPQDAQTKEQEWPEWLTSRRLAYQESAEVAEDVKVKTHSNSNPKLIPRA